MRVGGRNKKKPVINIDSDDLFAAASKEETRIALRRRGRAIIRRGVICSLLVFASDAVINRYISNDGFLATVVIILLIVCFCGFLSALWAWAGFAHMRYILKRNPWVEWCANVDLFEVGGLGVLRTVVLAHPDWPGEEVRTVHPLRAATVLANSKTSAVWVAGDPTRSLAISSDDGSVLLHALRPPFKWMRTKIKRHAQRPSVS